ncbi:hypothetical protein CCH79_00007909, partial [Gambusia affinis]
IMADFSLTSAVDCLAQEPRGPSSTPLVLEHRGSTRDLPQHPAASLLVPEYLDSIPHRELRVSFPPAPGRLDSSPGIIRLKELLDSCPEAPLLTHRGRFLLGLALRPALIQTCLSLVGSQQEATGCTAQEVRVDFPLRLVQDLSQRSLEVDSPRYHPGRGDHPEEVSRPRLLSLAPDPWVRTVVLLVQEAHW